MALRIAGNRPMQEELPMEEEVMEPEMMEEEMPMEEPQDAEILGDDMAGGGMLDPMIAGYKGPEMGPFMCGACQHYSGEGVCNILSSPVDEAGICNIFTPAERGESEEVPMEEEAMPEEEMPMEEPEMEEV